MRIMVTGGAGFVGTAFVRSAVEAGHKVLNFDALTSAASLAEIWDLEENPNYQLVPGNICNGVEISQSLSDFQPEAVVHLAAEVNPASTSDAARDLLHTNVNGTFELLEAVRSYCDGSAPSGFRLVQLDEDETRRPGAAAPFAATKKAAAIFNQSWQANYQLPMITATSSASYGPRQFPDKLIPSTILSALQGKTIHVPEGPGAVQDWIFVRDQAEALLWATTDGDIGENYQILGGEIMPQRAMVSHLCRLLQVKYPQKGLNYGSLMKPKPITSSNFPSLSDEFAKPDWSPRFSFEDGLAQTVDWFLQNEVWWRPLIEHQRNKAADADMEAVA